MPGEVIDIHGCFNTSSSSETVKRKPALIVKLCQLNLQHYMNEHLPSVGASPSIATPSCIQIAVDCWCLMIIAFRALLSGFRLRFPNRCESKFSSHQASLWVNLQLSRLPQAPLGLNWMTASNFLAISGQLPLRAVHRLCPNGEWPKSGDRSSLPSFHPFHFGLSPSSTLMFATHNLMKLGNRVFGFALGVRLRLPVF